MRTRNMEIARVRASAIEIYSLSSQTYTDRQTNGKKTRNIDTNSTIDKRESVSERCIEIKRNQKYINTLAIYRERVG
jgi:hypothetical protein